MTNPTKGKGDDGIPSGHEYITPDKEDFQTGRVAYYNYCLECRQACKSDELCDCCYNDFWKWATEDSNNEESEETS